MTHGTAASPYIGTTPLSEARMTRTILAAVGLIGLAACGGGSHHTTKTKAPAASSSSRAATQPRTATRATSQTRKGAARRDTTGQRNPLTNR